MKIAIPPQVLPVVIRVGVYTFLAIFGMYLFAWFFLGLNYFVASPLSVFAAAAMANALAMRIYEHANLMEVGFHWNRAAVRHLLLGLAGGIVSGLFVTLGPVLQGGASLVPIQGAQPNAWSIVMVVVVILFGGIGEELLFRGYGFQVLMNALGPFATILPVAVLFALAHAENLNVSNLALVNTGLWGVLLGIAFWKSGDLWLATGLHVGWNWALPLMGVPLSGFKIVVTGYEMRSEIDPLWSGGAYGPEGGLLTTAVLALLFLWLVWKAPVRRQTPFLLRQRWEEF